MSAPATESNEYALYHYSPSVVAAIIFAVLFGATTTWHTWQMFQRRTWYFTAFVIGGLFEFVGYAARAQSARETPDWTLTPYIIQSLLILLGPSFFAASIYMILGHVIRLTDGESHSIIRTRWLTPVFVTGDVISFCVQGGGGGMLASATDESGVTRGNNVILGGLVIQVLFFGFFIIVAAIFHLRIRRVPTGTSAAIRVPWQRYFWVLYAASSFIIVRCVFRIAEYAGGQTGPLLSTEVYLYIFDATLMLLVMLLFNVQHPSSIISKKIAATYGMMSLNV